MRYNKIYLHDCNLKRKIILIGLSFLGDQQLQTALHQGQKPEESRTRGTTDGDGPGEVGGHAQIDGIKSPNKHSVISSNSLTLHIQNISNYGTEQNHHIPDRGRTNTD